MKKILISFLILMLFFVVLCFVPFNANKLIPNVESQILSQFGLNAKIDKLTLKLAPTIIIKSPKFILTYDNNKQLADISGIKIKLYFLPLLKKEVKIKYLRVDTADLSIKLDNNDKPEILSYLKSSMSNITNISNVRFKHYNVALFNKYDEKYIFSGSEFVLKNNYVDKFVKIASSGKLLIDGIKFIDYDISLAVDQFDSNNLSNCDFLDLLRQIKMQKANASIVANLNIKKVNEKYHADGSLSLDKVTLVMNGSKLPFSHASFNMLGNRTSLSAVIYTNSTDKLSVNGYYINSDNPSFNISAKSDEINLKDIVCFSRLFSDVSNLDQIKDVSGNLYADFSLKGSFKKIKSNGVLKISNASLLTKNTHVTNFNSDISFDDNKIDIKNTKGYINSAPFTVLGNIISNNINLNLVVDKFHFENVSINGIDLKSGIISIIANISGTSKNIVPKIEAEIDNCFGNYNSIKYKFNKLSYVSTNKNLASLKIKNLIYNMPQTSPVSVLAFNANIVNSDINIQPFEVLSKNTKLIISGKAFNFDNDKLSFTLSGKGFVNPCGLFNYKALNTTLPVYLEISGDKYTYNINAQALQQTSSALIAFLQPVIFNLNAKFSNNELKIIDGSVNTYKGEFTSNLKKNIVNSSKIAVITGSIEDLFHPVFKNVKLNILKTAYLKISHYDIKLNGSLVVNGYIRNPEIVGILKFPIISDKYGCLVFKNAVITLTKNIINFNCSSAKVFDSLFSLLGSADTNIKNGFKVKNINIKSRDIDFDNLSLLLLIFQQFDVDLSIDNGSLYSENFKITTPMDVLQLTDLNSSFKLKKDILCIDSINANLYNGVIAGHAFLNTKDGKYTGFIQGRGISSGSILKNMTNIKENISGKLDFDMDFNSSIKSKFLKNANIKFIIKDGQMSTLGKVEHLLYAQNIIADNMLKTSFAVIGRAISSKDTGLFKYLNGVIIVNDDVVKIKSIKMLGPNMSLYVTGNYGLMSNVANLNIIGRLSNTIVSSLGSFGTFSMDKFRIALTGDSSEETRFIQQGIESLPQLPQRNTKEFKSIIYGPLEAKTSVRSFMWISETEKEYRTKEVRQTNTEVPKFIENLPY